LMWGGGGTRTPFRFPPCKQGYNPACLHFHVTANHSMHLAVPPRSPRMYESRGFIPEVK